jgi:hypothetical protein
MTEGRKRLDGFGTTLVTAILGILVGALLTFVVEFAPVRTEAAMAMQAVSYAKETDEARHKSIDDKLNAINAQLTELNNHAKAWK